MKVTPLADLEEYDDVIRSDKTGIVLFISSMDADRDTYISLIEAVANTEGPRIPVYEFNGVWWGGGPATFNAWRNNQHISQLPVPTMEELRKWYKELN